MGHYKEDVERRMKVLFARLSEKDRRRYAAVEADKLGHGGQQYIADLFGIDIKTIRQGLADLPRSIQQVLDHDFPSYSEGKVVPYGLYDIGKNKAHVNLGTSRDTTEFACDSIAHWWTLHGRRDHPQAREF
jgi:hypothetical protein